MSRAWLTSPVIGTGAEDDPFRPAVFDREGSPGDRLEAVIDAEKSSTCLVGYDVADDSDMAGLGGERLLAEADLDKAADRIPEGGRARLDAMARDAKVGRTGSAREVLRRIGQTISPTFDERLHLGSGEAPPTGSFLSDTFTDEAGTFLENHTPESGGSWTRIADLAVISNANRARAESGTMAYLAPGTPEGPEYDIASELVVFDEDGRMGPVGRSDSEQNNGYFYDYEFEGGTKTWRIQKRVAGSFTLLGSFKETLELETAYPIVCEIRDAAKKLYVKGVERVSTTDNAVTDAGVVGLRHTGSNDSDAEGIHVSSLTATDAGGGEAKTIEVADAISVGDSAAKDVVVVREDAVSISDTAARGVVKTLADTVNVSDAFARAAQYVRRVTDSVSVSDSLSRGVEKRLRDAVAVSDSRSFAVSKRLTDAVGIAESLTRRVLKRLADALGLSDEADIDAAGEPGEPAYLYLADAPDAHLHLGDSHTTSLALSDAPTTYVILEDDPS